MYTRDTIYRLATTAADYRACHALTRQLAKDWGRLRFPTVMAERDGKLVGFLSTRDVDWCLMAGPLEVAIPSPFLSMRLIEAYEAMLHHLGVTRYCFSIDRHNKRWLEQVRVAHMPEIAEDEDWIVFERIFESDPLYVAEAA